MKRVKLPDGTQWPMGWPVSNDPENRLYEFREITEAYFALIDHPWGVKVSIQKLRWLRKACKESMK